jgi:hypothetical protein
MLPRSTAGFTTIEVMPNSRGFLREFGFFDAMLQRRSPAQIKA